MDKIESMRLIFSESDMQRMLAVKDVFNPKGLCNPGKVIPTTKTCRYADLAWKTSGTDWPDASRDDFSPRARSRFGSGSIVMMFSQPRAKSASRSSTSLLYRDLASSLQAIRAFE